jgi:hypothetical protein
MAAEKIRMALVAMALLAAFWVTKREWHSWGDDNALYLHQARALAEHTVTDLEHRQRWMLANTTEEISPLLYPWGIPIMLYLANVAGLPLEKAGWWVNSVWLLLAMLFGLSAWRKSLGWVVSGLAALLIIVHPAITVNRLETGAASVAFALQVLVGCCWVTRGSTLNGGSKFLWNIGGGLLFAVAINIHLTMLSLLPLCLAAIWLHNSGWRNQLKGIAVFGTAAALVIFPLFLLLPKPVYESVEQAGHWIQIDHWASQFVKAISSIWNDILLAAGKPWIIGLFLIPAGIGLWKNFKQLKWLLFALVAHVALLCLSPYPPFGRYLLIALPLFLLSVSYGTKYILENYFPAKCLSACWPIAIVFSLGFLMYLNATFYTLKRELIYQTQFGPQSRSFQEVVSVLEAQLPDTLAINFPKARWLQYWLPNPVFFQTDNERSNAISSAIVVFRPELGYINYPPGYLANIDSVKQWRLIFMNDHFKVFCPAPLDAKGSKQ